MTDIFLSYHNSDRATAQIFADTLEARGWSVWWDREIPLGKSYDEVIEHELTTARCAMVLWSEEAVRSRWVRTEASVAATRECLVPVMIEEAPIPLEFRQIQTAMLIGWNGDTTDPEYTRLTDALVALIGRPQTSPVVAQPVAVRSRRGEPAWRNPKALRAAIAAVLLLVAYAFFKNVGGTRDATGPDETGGTFVDGVQAGASSSAPGTPQPVPADAFEIAIGDAVSDGAPKAGAGIIEAPHGKDVYVFNAKPGQGVYFRVMNAGGLPYINWTLTDEVGMQVFDSCFGCGDPGVQQLTRGGRYTLLVGSDRDSSTGAYEFRLYDVAAPSTFAIKIGDTIEEGVPEKGAGTVETPGAHDVFTFTAAPRQRVYFRMLEHSRGMEYIAWKVTDDDGMEVFAACLGCGTPGVHTLLKGGTYQLAVGNKTNWATGTYRLQLTNVPPPDRFSIRVSDRIRIGVPGKGAGAIEVPGAEDVYVFTAAAGQQVAPRLLEHDPSLSQIIWRLVDSNDMEVFSSCFGCGAPGVQRLTAGGQYTLLIGNPRDHSTGTYSFELVAVR